MALTTVRSTGIGSLPAISGANLTSLNASNISSGTLNSARFSGGKVLQVVQATHGTETNTNSSSYQQSGLTANITPSATSSKILIQYVLPMYQDASGGAICGALNAIFKGGSNLHEFGAVWGMTSRSINYAYQGTGFYRDAPNTTSQVTYDIRYRPYPTGSGQLIYACPDSNYGGMGTDSQATLILMEIGA
mgnify:CR=1 FL=1